MRIIILGEKEPLPPAQRQALLDAENRTQANTGLQLNIAINYGSRTELVRAARQMAREVRQGTLDPDAITDAVVEEHLYTHGLPPVDLLIRTSGEMRLSNFMLWQCAYAEFVFPQTLWPDFTVADYHACIAEFQSRSRRYGGRSE